MKSMQSKIINISIIATSFWIFAANGQNEFDSSNITNSRGPRKFLFPEEARKLALQQYFLQANASGTYNADDTARIVSGFPAPKKFAPYQVLVSIDQDTGYCGGTIIKSSWIITAGHCVVGFTDFKLYIGSVKFRACESETHVQIRTNTQVFPHDDYDEVALLHDIALIKFSPPVHEDGKYIVYAKLPKNDATYLSTDHMAGRKARISGWGAVNPVIDNPVCLNLQYGVVPIISTESCREKFGAGIVESIHICTSTAQGIGICFGDSGGPLVVLRKGRGGRKEYVVFGASSFVSDLFCTNGYSAFTSVQGHINWIISTIKRNTP